MVGERRIDKVNEATGLSFSDRLRIARLRRMEGREVTGISYSSAESFIMYSTDWLGKNFEPAGEDFDKVRFYLTVARDHIKFMSDVVARSFDDRPDVFRSNFFNERREAIEMYNTTAVRFNKIGVDTQYILESDGS